MQIIKTSEELASLTDNAVIGAENLTMQNSELRFNGSGNVLFVEEGVTLSGSKINFACSNSVVYLSSSHSLYKLNVMVNNNCSCYIGKNNYMNGTLNITVSEQTNVFIGDDCLFAFDIWVRTADPHLIYSAATKKRVNPSKSVYIGDHIWLGQSALVLKGTQIASGCIVGAAAVVSGKKTGCNESWAGNPARLIGSEIFWDKRCVHAFTDKETQECAACDSEQYVYSFVSGEHKAFDGIESELKQLKTAGEKAQYFKSLSENKTKNRFAVKANGAKRGIFHK